MGKKKPTRSSPRKAAHYVHVNGHTLKRNRATGECSPPVALRRGRSGRSSYGHVVEVLDADGRVAATVAYRPDGPLSCGAVVYVVCPHGARVAQPPAAQPAQSA